MQKNMIMVSEGGEENGVISEEESNSRKMFEQ